MLYLFLILSALLLQFRFIRMPEYESVFSEHYMHLRREFIKMCMKVDVSGRI